MVEELENGMEQTGDEGEKTGDPSAANSTSLGEEAMGKQGKQIDISVATSRKSVVTTRRQAGEEADTPAGPVGIDVGTSHIVVAHEKNDDVQLVRQLDAFFTVPKSNFTRGILTENRVTFFEADECFYIIGYSAEGFAHMFSSETRRPMTKGILSATEPIGIEVIKAVIGTLIQRPKKFGEVACFAVPGEPVEGTGGSVVYHESIMRNTLASVGYTPFGINEALAVVMSELADNAFTGIGISMGGGMCNVCLAYLSVPVVTYSIQKAGDYIDSMVGQCVGETAIKVRSIKENSSGFLKNPGNRIETGLQVFYDDVILSLLGSLQKVLSMTDRLPKISSPMPIVLSGGSAAPEGLKERFEKQRANFRFPVEVADVRLAKEPLYGTVKGALVKALSEQE